MNRNEVMKPVDKGTNRHLGRAKHRFNSVVVSLMSICMIVEVENAMSCEACKQVFIGKPVGFEITMKWRVLLLYA